jgi:hypothetical protein
MTPYYYGTCTVQINNVFTGTKKDSTEAGYKIIMTAYYKMHAVIARVRVPVLYVR